jgi:hypothetical protein
MGGSAVGIGYWATPTAAPERKNLRVVLAISANFGRRAVNRKSREFAVERFGSPGAIRTYDPWVNAGRSQGPIPRKQNHGKMFPEINIAMPTLTNEIITAALLGFEEQKRRIDAQIAELRAILTVGAKELRPLSAPQRPRRRLSAATRKAMAEGQRKRWASKTSVEPPALTKPKRKMSAAGKAAIVAALKKRWAAKRAEAKK